MKQRTFSPARPLIVAIAGVGLLLAGHLLPLGGEGYIAQQVRNSLHGPAFLAFTAVFFLLARASLGTLGAALISATAALLAAPGGEFLQYLTGKDTSLADIAHDWAGAAATLLVLGGWFAWRDGRIDRRRRREILAVGGLLALVVAAPLTWWLYVAAARASSMPVLADFERRGQTALLGGLAAELSVVARPDHWPGRGDYVLEVRLRQSRYAGVDFLAPPPDWTGYASLRFLAATGDGTRRRLTLRIHDATHNQAYGDRFNGRWPIGPEPAQICVPLAEIRQAPKDRSMDLSAIAGMIFFLTGNRGGEVFLLDDVTLTKSACPEDLQRTDSASRPGFAGLASASSPASSGPSGPARP
ncbi:carbohydrate binding domain-containing protein [Thiococcus pfennigii]|uniref:carbohydrate binding domain-containing protein n=1 Tax=Thiococcus pfennigii TaxID=1057 RepID=UPI001908008F|nr:carbohydrate binding domain-containing protein [Thiococcus pfennigii]MBK1731693.1 hypothetical protein [Thiococcus pfennigii]